jgi:glycosyltransferase involved in cell wall biosynthesis
LLIGQFCETYPPFLDGVGRVMLSYCETLSQMGHRSVYVAPRHPGFPDGCPGCETLLYPSLPVHRQYYRFGLPWLSRAFRRAAKDIPFDVVHIHTPFLAGMAALNLAKKIGAPVVGTFHSKYYDDFYKATRSQLLAKVGLSVVIRFFRSCDEVWAVSGKTADVLRDYGYKGEIVIMPNGTNILSVTDAERKAALEQYPLRDGIPVLIFAGQQDYKKNVESVLRACALLMERGLDFQLIMAGGGPNLDELRNLARKLKLMERTVFTGFLSERSALLSLFERADLMVFPSLYDNAPMVVREAASMGTPSLLVEGTCSAEGMSHNKNGFLCRNTPESIADAITSALPLCKAVGEQARATIPIPWNEILAQVMERYEDLIALKKKAAGRGVRSAV